MAKFWGCEDRAFPLVSVVLAAAFVLPVWSSRFLPLLDEPNHLSALYIWNELADSASPLHAYYRHAFAPVSYLLHYGLSYLLSFVLGVELAHKLVLSAYVLAFPVAGWLWCRATQRTVWLCLLTMPLAYSTAWSLGYHSFDAGVAVCLFAVVAQDALLRAPRARAALLVGVLSVACYFGHPLPLVMLWVCTLVLWCLARPGWRAIAWSATSLLPSVLLYSWQSSAAGVTAAGTRELLGPNFLRFSPEWVRDRVLSLPAYAVNPLAGSGDTAVFEAMLGLVLLLFAVGAARPARCRGLVLALGLLGLYMLLPNHFAKPVYMWIACGRVAPVAAFFLLLSPAIAEGMRARWLVLVAALLGALIPLRTALAYRSFGREMFAFENVLAVCPKGQQVLTIALGGADRLAEGFDQPVYRQLASWVQVVHGGYNPSEFPRPVASPFAVTRRLPVPLWRHHERYAQYLKPELYGCVLSMDLNVEALEGYSLGKREGRFALWCAEDSQGASRCGVGSAQ
ncbi:MAG: hypothetical protein RLZZ450_1209 [Pseudomonadota bacterium]